MVKKLLFSLSFAAVMAGFPLASDAQSGFTLIDDSTSGAGMSSNGRYLVGNHARYSDSKAFIYDRTTGELTWVTEYDTENLENTGVFADVSDNGVICGKSFDPEHTITVQDFDGTRTYPLNVAAVWKDGVRTAMPWGDIDMSVFQQSGDGTYLHAITADGTKVAGYYSVANMAYYYPLVWTANGDTWAMEHPALPDGMKNGRVRAISDDGSVMAGTVDNPSESKYYVAYWKDGNVYTVDPASVGVEDASWVQMSFSSLSPNGRFIALNVMGTDDWLFDVTTGEARKLPNIEEGRPMSTTMSVDNEGNVVGGISFGSIFFGGEVYNRPLYYSYSENRLLDLSYYMSIFAPDADPSIPMSYEEKTQAMPYGISGDGRYIAGNADTYLMLQQKPKTWLLQVDKDSKMEVPATPSGVEGKSEALGEVLLTWDKDTRQYDAYTLKSYNVYRDSLEAVSVDASGDVMSLHQTGLKGHPRYVVEAVYETADGRTILSPKSNALKVSVPDTYSLPFYDDFEKASLDSAYWETSADYGDKYDIMWSTMQQSGMSFSTALNGQIYSQKPYSASVISRPMDARGASSVNMSFAFIYGFVNIEGQPLDKDSIAVETTVDNGKTWVMQKEWSVEELCPKHLWNIANLRLEGVEGKLFKMRIRKFGQGAAMYYSSIDNVKVDAVPEKDAPAGLFGMLGKDGKTVTIAWKNDAGAYQLSHLPAMADGKYAIGNEGAEVIAANAFDGDTLKLYDGKYLTAVTNTFNYYTSMPGELGLHGTVVVYEDNNLVREQEMTTVNLNAPTTTVLDEPLKIDPSKELKIGIKIHDYDAQQIPLLYAITSDCKPGKSDLFSEDGGKTWQSLYEYYENQGSPEMGQCVWMITGEITDTPQYTALSEEDEQPYAYNVFRDGVQISQFALDGSQSVFTDKPDNSDASYTVMAYYADGKRSAESKSLSVDDVTSVRTVTTDGMDFTTDYVNGQIRINSQYDSASLIGVSGMTVATAVNGSLPISGLSDGVYILKVNNGKNVSTKKIMLRR